MELNEYQTLAFATAVYDRSLAVLYPALGLAGEAGETANKVKKMFRDDGGVLTEAKRQEIKKELGDVLWYVAGLAHDAGLTLDEIAEANIAKLGGRKERGTLRGSGDNR